MGPSVEMAGGSLEDLKRHRAESTPIEFLEAFRDVNRPIVSAIRRFVRKSALLDLTHHYGNHQRMLCARGVLGVLLAILIAGLTPIAYADPPDPTWLGGYWDDDDLDNVVLFIASAAAIAASPVADGRPSSVCEHAVELARPPARSAPFQALACPRAPPVSLSPDS
jgi:hypothetical protein